MTFARKNYFQLLKNFKEFFIFILTMEKATKPSRQRYFRNIRPTQQQQQQQQRQQQQ